MKYFLTLVGLLLGTMFLFSCGHSRGSIVLINKTDETIVSALITIGEQQIALENIMPETSKTQSYEIRVDGHLNLRVEFISGKVIQKNIGYITNDVEFRHEITVSKSGIEVTDLEIK